MNHGVRTRKSIVRWFLPGVVYSWVKRSLERHSHWMSQAGQDVWVYGESFNEMRGGYFLDIGAHDGVFLSNTFLLESRYGWNGICVEANPVTFAELIRNRKSICCNVCLDAAPSTVRFALDGVMGGIISSKTDNITAGPEVEIIETSTDTLESILVKNNSPHVVDYMSIDIEGAEERVLSSFNFSRYRFNCITIERPTSQLRSLFHKHNYLLLKDIPGLDCFYIHEEFKDQYVENMYRYYGKKLISWRWS